MRMVFGFNLLLVIIFSYLYMVSNTFIRTTISTDYIGGDGFPKLVIVLAIAILVYDCIKLLKKFKEVRGSKVQEQETFFQKQGKKQLFIGIFLVGAYVFAVEAVGYIVTTVLFIIFLLKSMGYNKTLKGALFSVFFVTAIVLVFGNVFGILLPRGFGFLRGISYYLY